MKLAVMMGTLCIATVAMVGCSSKTVDPKEYSGFLKDYSQLKEAKSPSGAEVMRWMDPKLDINKFSSVYVEPSQLYPKPQPTAKISQQTLNGITSATTTRRSSVSSAKTLPLADRSRARSDCGASGDHRREQQDRRPARL
jgi:hypothetical protein